jgi:hypothetical protein
VRWLGERIVRNVFLQEERLQLSTDQDGDSLAFGERDHARLISVAEHPFIGGLGMSQPTISPRTRLRTVHGAPPIPRD